MATTVGQHSVAAFTSPVNGTTPIDANSVRGNDNTVRSAYVDHDADPGIHVQSSTLASRPAAGTAGRKWITEDSGVYTLWFDDGTNWHPVSSENINLTVLATETLVKGDVVKVTGWNNGQDLPEVAKVSSTSDTAFAIITANVANGAMGYATNTGIVQDLATNGFSVGAILYPNSSGWFTATKPTSGTYQPCAYVLRSNANNGVLYVEFSAPRIVEASANTASTIVLRDASGNFSAGTITATALTASGAVSAGSVTSTGLVTFASLKGTGATTVTNILDEDNMASDSATALATQQSIKAYVDAKVATVDTLAEVLANGNTTGANDIIVNAGQKIRTPLIASQNNATAITIADTTGALTFASALADSNLATISTAGKVSNSATTATSANTASAIVARDSSGNFSAGTITAALTGNASTATTLQTARNINGVSFNGSADITVTAAAGTLTGNTLASGVTASSLTSVGTLTSLTVSGNTYVATTSGNLGVGTTSTSAKIHAFSASGSSALYLQNGTATTGKTWKVDSFSDGNLYIGIPAVVDALSITPAGNLAVDTNTLYVDAANNRVGVGTASPAAGYALDVVGVIRTTSSTNTEAITATSATDNTGLVLTNTASNGATWKLLSTGGASGYGAGNLAFERASTLRMTLDASGNLGLGVTPSANDYTGVLQLKWIGHSITPRAVDNLAVSMNAYHQGGGWKYGNNGVASLYLQNSGSHTWFTAASGTAGNAITFTQAMTLSSSTRGILTVGPSGEVGSIGTDYATVGVWNTAGGGYRIYRGTGAGTSSAIFYADSSTTTIGSSENLPFVLQTNSTERARITSGGDFLVQQASSTDTPTTGFAMIYNGGGSLIGIGHANGTANATSFATFAYNGSRIGWIEQDSTTTVKYNTSSDRRLKENIAPAGEAGDIIDAINIVSFDWKGGEHARFGIIAQDEYETVPEAVSVGDDEDVEELRHPWSVDYSKLVPMLVKEIQSLRARVAALEA